MFSKIIDVEEKKIQNNYRCPTNFDVSLEKKKRRRYAIDISFGGEIYKPNERKHLVNKVCFLRRFSAKSWIFIIEMTYATPTSYHTLK